MKLVIDIPMTEEEIKNEIKETVEDFRRRGLLPIEESEVRNETDN